MVNFRPLMAEIDPVVWGTQLISAGFVPWQHYCMALQYWASAKLSGVEQRGATYIRQGGHQVGHWPTFLV